MVPGAVRVALQVVLQRSRVQRRAVQGFGAVTALALRAALLVPVVVALGQQRRIWQAQLEKLAATVGPVRPLRLLVPAFFTQAAVVVVLHKTGQHPARVGLVAVVPVVVLIRQQQPVSLALAAAAVAAITLWRVQMVAVVLLSSVMRRPH